MQQMMTDLWTRKKWTEKFEKPFSLKLLEICKTRFRKSSPDMFTFYVVLAGRNLVADVAGLTHAGGISKPHHYKQRVQKMKDLPKTWVLTANQFEGFRRINNKKHL